LVFNLLQLQKESKEMSKLKTKSGVKKRFRVTASGLIKVGAAFRRHRMRNRTQRMKRQSRGPEILAAADAEIIKKFMPYNR